MDLARKMSVDILSAFDTDNDRLPRIIDKYHKKNDVLSEINRRIGMPLYIPVITLIVCFLLNQRDESKFKNYYK